MENNNKLAKIALGINAVLIVLVIVIFTKLQGNNSNESIAETTIEDSLVSVETPTELTGKFGFFNLDSLNSKLSLFKEIENEMKSSTTKAESKMKKKQGEISAWEKKWSSKGQLLSSEQETYMKEAQKMQNDAMQFEQNVQMVLQQEQAQLMETYAIRLADFNKRFAQKNGYDAVFAFQFGQSPWYYNPALDITNELADMMNAEFDANNAPIEDSGK
jgi:Skp family chaperone for outer membrane proteins